MNKNNIVIAIVVAVSMTFAIGIMPIANAANNFEVVSECDIVLVGTWDIDFEKCALGGDIESLEVDLWWEHVTESTHNLVPLNGAEIANLGVVDSNTITDPTNTNYSYITEKIDGSFESIPEGTILLIKTTDGNYAKMLIENYGYDLTVKVQLMKQVS